MNMSLDSAETGFQNAVNAFAADEPVGEPNAGVEGQAFVAPPVAAPPPEEAETEAGEPEPSEPADAEPKEAAPPAKPSEFVEFTTPEQKQRFNDVFGYAKRLERELQSLTQRIQQPVTPQPKPPIPAAPQLTDDKPKLANYESADDWADAVSDWAASKAERSAVTRANMEFQQRQEQEQQARYAHFLQSKTEEGYKKYGQQAFDSVCFDVASVAPPGSTMNQILFGLNNYSDVVLELGKNLQEADRISRLSQVDQIYELKALEKKILTREELSRKAHVKIPTKVEAPGQGEDAKAGVNTAKLRQQAYKTGRMQDFAKVFEGDATL